MSRDVERLLARTLKFTRLTWDAEHCAMRLFMRVRPVQCFGLAALREFQGVLNAVSDMPRGTVRQFAVCSDVDGVFNFGGDLSLFVLLVRSKSRDGLKMYGNLCVELVHWFERAAEREIHTLALVKGDALGGGLESILPIHRIVMERQAEAGFPEALFNLYPGMGAWNFTSRRAGTGVATKMILSGGIYKAEELLSMGVIDVVADTGDGDAALQNEIRKGEPRLRGKLSALRIRSLLEPVTLESLRDVVYDWAEQAMGLSDRDLRLMERLARAQLKKVGGSLDGAIEEIKRVELEEALEAQRAASPVHLVPERAELLAA